MLHLHFEFLERTHEGYLLTDEHHEMLAAIQAKDVERADKLAHDHTRQFRDSFIAFMKENYATDIAAGADQHAAADDEAEIASSNVDPRCGHRADRWSRFTAE